MTWSIDPGSARSIISSARAETSSLDEAASAVADRFAEAARAAQHAPRTVGALTNLAADPFLVAIASVRRRIVAVTDTADAVIDVYVAGDLEMSAQTQAAMPGDGS
ncbi:DUF6507 family protein [Microbacterium enclense]|uniref:DUF6507 family protein n=1 Tax=Microbacterium enclense TaxID=993073 RepID=UPI002041CD40|nr:DUF6507 family protein [Microbacterium enclense]MCM3615208.1 DUF6507 family protein [Microbacterium enclense]